ncbi:unnamed protein product [Rotaria magnacalcarata]
MYPRRANKNYCSKILRTQKRMNSSTFIRRIAKNISFILQINVFLFYPTSKTYDMPINMLRICLISGNEHNDKTFGRDSRKYDVLIESHQYYISYTISNSSNIENVHKFVAMNKD